MAPEVRFNAFGIPYLVEFANVSFRRSRSRSGSVSTSTTHLESVSRSSTPSLHKPTLEREPLLFRRLRPSRSSRSVATFDSDWTFPTASSETLTTAAAAAATLSRSKGTTRRSASPVPPSPLLSLTSKPLPEITIESEIETDGEGLLIRFASQLTQPPRKLSQHRLARLKYRIAKAVMAVGMDSSPAAVELGDPMDAVSSSRGSCHNADVNMNRLSCLSIRSEEVETRGMPSSFFRGTYGQVMAALTAAGLTAAPCKESGMQGATRLGALFVAHQNVYGGVEFSKLTLWA